MANIIIPEGSDSKVDDLMGRMGVKQRPTILRIALSKGIIHQVGEPPNVDDKTKGREIPLTTLCPGNNLVVVKHCIIQKNNKYLEGRELNSYIRRYLVSGINYMWEEVNGLDELDNYLIYLAESTNNLDAQERIKSLLGF